MPEVEVLLATQADYPAIEQFCDENPRTTLYYRPRWQQVLASSYGHARDHWIARSEGRVVGHRESAATTGSPQPPRYVQAVQFDDCTGVRRPPWDWGRNNLEWRVASSSTRRLQNSK